MPNASDAADPATTTTIADMASAAGASPAELAQIFYQRGRNSFLAELKERGMHNLE